jgi:hypothetical protein
MLVQGNRVIGRIACLRSTFALVLVACSLSGCERTTHVKLEGGAAPVFELSGSGAVAILTVYSPDYITKAESPNDENFALWEIKPSGGYLHGTWIRDLGSITYGVVPPGYVQVKPQAGSPPPLTEGQRYFFTVETTAAPGAAGFVEIRNSQAVQTHGGGPCFGRKDKKWIRMPCT